MIKIIINYNYIEILMIFVLLNKIIEKEGKNNI